MRKHDVRKWLHAILDLLPVIIIPVFMIYSHRHTIDNYEIQYAQNEVVDFNQYKQSFGEHTYTQNSVDITMADYSLSMVGTADDTFIFNFGTFQINQGHKYYLRYNVVSIYNVFRVGDFNNGSSISFTDIGCIYEPVSSPYLAVEVISGSNININFTFNAFDLTQMFGSGNEPTIEEFNLYFPNEYYEYTTSKTELVKNVGTITYNDTDIGSQMLYCLYNTVDKYFNFNNVFGFNNVYDWLSLNIFNGNPPIAIYIVWNIALYEFLMDLIMLLYALFMWFIDMCESLIDRSFHVASGRKK